jgi:hypothetical protein
MDIKRSEMLDDGVYVEFDNGWYYAHCIGGIGEEDDKPAYLNTMWAWINHMRSKRWWSPYLESRFIKEVSSYF